MTRDFAVLKAEVLIRIYCNKPTAETIAMSAEISLLIIMLRYLRLYKWC